MAPKMDSEPSEHVYELNTSFTSTTDDFSVRPQFTRKEYLLKLYSCCLCMDILVQPQQTICGSRACKACLDEKFGLESSINCPVPHDYIDEKDLSFEPCQQSGLRKNEVSQDTACQRVLLREKCFCPNKPFGCSETPTWKKLKDHLLSCLFTPVLCPNANCPEKFAKESLDRHLKQCPFMVVPCGYCGERFRRNQLEEHYGKCEKADFRCNNCGIMFDRRKQKVVAEEIMTVKKVSDTHDATQINGDHLVNALRTVAHSSQQIEQVSGKVGVIERQIRDFGLDRVTVIESHSQNIRRHNELLNDFENQIKVHRDQSQLVHSLCKECGKSFETSTQLMVHQKIHVPCITTSGKCPFRYCNYMAPMVELSKYHMETNKDSHCEAIVQEISDLEHKVTKICETLTAIKEKKKSSTVNLRDKKGKATKVEKSTKKSPMAEITQDNPVEAVVHIWPQKTNGARKRVESNVSSGKRRRKAAAGPLMNCPYCKEPLTWENGWHHLMHCSKRGPTSP